MAKKVKQKLSEYLIENSTANPDSESDNKVIDIISTILVWLILIIGSAALIGFIGVLVFGFRYLFGI